MTIHVFKCSKCNHEWATKRDRPRMCPRCKSAYWDIPTRMEVFMRASVTCPLCFDREFSSFLNLARHMVLSDRPNGPHQQWLQRFLRLPFESYAFGKDKAIALRLKAYWEKHRSWSELDA